MIPPVISASACVWRRASERACASCRICVHPQRMGCDGTCGWRYQGVCSHPFTLTSGSMSVGALPYLLITPAVQSFEVH